jgi:hypothetical protein
LIRAFKDAKDNYYMPGNGSGLCYFTAIRVPQALENPRLQRLVKKGQFNAEELVALEACALNSLRAYDRGEAELEDALADTIKYGAILVAEMPYAECAATPQIRLLEARYRTTLAEKPWKACPCAICKQASIDIVIFRGSNRNKRRGMHNLAVYQNHLQGLDLVRAANDSHELLRDTCTAER